MFNAFLINTENHRGMLKGWNEIIFYYDLPEISLYTFYSS